MHRLPEPVDDVLDDVVDVFFGARLELLALLLALGEDLLALGLDVFARLCQTLLLQLGGLRLGFLADLFRALASLGDPLFAVLLGLGNDFVSLAFGLLDSFENLWPRHVL